MSMAIPSQSYQYPFCPNPSLPNLNKLNKISSIILEGLDSIFLNVGPTLQELDPAEEIEKLIEGIWGFRQF